MTRITKLYDRFRSGSSLSFDEFVRLIEAFGFDRRRVSGSHRIYARDDIPEQLNIQPSGKELKPYQRRQFEAIIAKYGLTLGDDA